MPKIHVTDHKHVFNSILFTQGKHDASFDRINRFLKKKTHIFTSTMSTLSVFFFITLPKNQGFLKTLIRNRRFYSPADTLTAIMKSPDSPRWCRSPQKLAQTISCTRKFKFHKSDDENIKKSVKISPLGEDLTIDGRTSEKPQCIFRNIKYQFYAFSKLFS